MMPVDAVALWAYIQTNPSKAALAFLVVICIGVIGAILTNAADKKAQPTNNR